MEIDFLEHEPMTEEEALGLLQKGEYEACVINVEIKIDKNNKQYFRFTLDVYDNNGKPKIVWDNVWTYKLKHFYDACDMSDKYQSTKLSTLDCKGKNIRVKVGVQGATEQYPRPKNVILDYLKPKTDSISHSPVHLVDDKFNDAIPF